MNQNRKVAVVLALFLGGAPMLYFVQEEAPLACKREEWRPMIWWVSRVYSPLVANSASGPREALTQMVPWIRLCPWEQEPNIVVPTIEHRIPAEQLSLRLKFFGENYMAVLLCFCILLEAILFGFQKWSKMRTLQTNVVEDDSPTKLQVEATPLSVEDDHLTKPLMNKTEGQKGYLLQPFPRMFVLWYIAFQIYVWINTDIAVSGGLINTTSGMAWEAYAPLLFFELGTHLSCAIMRYRYTGGQMEQYPSVLILPCLLPWLGSTLHIWKDHMFAGLCFSVAHCRDDWKSYAALLLGYFGILINVVSVKVLLFSETKVVEGLHAAHWPILEACHKVATGDPLISWKARKKEFLSSAIGACTLEKQKRALYAELPHTVIHVLFLFILGGSPFVYASIALSGAKLFFIPFLRGWLKNSPRMIREIGCGPDAMKRLWINIFEKEDDNKNTFLKLAFIGGHVEIIDQFLPEARQLKELVLTNMGLEDVAPLARALESNTSIERLDLFRNAIKDVAPLARALESNTSITYLDLRLNPIKVDTELEKVCGEKNVKLEI